MRKWILRLVASSAGLSREKIALMVVVGLVLGTFPVVGCPTLLCSLAALILGLNLPILQLINQIATPVQFVMLLPMARAGSWIVGHHSGFAGTMLSVLAGWFLICIPAGIVLYAATVFVLRRTRATAS